MFCKVDEDEPLFLSLIGDLFPGITLDSATYVELQAAIEKHAQEMVVVNHPPWNLKVLLIIKMFSCFVLSNGMPLLFMKFLIEQRT